jgi:hypothetical protein
MSGQIFYYVTAQAGDKIHAASTADMSITVAYIMNSQSQEMQTIRTSQALEMEKNYICQRNCCE